jgi:putative hemolysin
VNLIAAHGVVFLIMLVLMALSCLFSASETALLSLTREQYNALKQKSSLQARMVTSLIRDRADLLVTVLVGNTFVNVLYFALSYGVAMQMKSSPLVRAVFGIGAFLVLLILCEVTPKGIAVRRPLAVSLVLGPIIWLIRFALTPVRIPLTRISRAAERLTALGAEKEHPLSAGELKMLLDLSQSQGEIDRHAHRMIAGVVELGSKTVRDLMIPRIDMVTFHLAKSNEEFLDLIRRTRHKHIPVYIASVDNIVGVVNGKDVYLNPQKRVQEFVREVLYVPETKTVEAMLHEFREKGQQLAIVVDEYGGTAGLITIEDIIEQVVGDIRDEHEQPEGDIRQVAPNTYLLSGDLAISAWREMFQFDAVPADVETLAGLVIALLGRLPKEGDTVTHKGIQFTVEAMKRRRVSRVRVQVPESPSEGGPARAG